MARKLNFYLTNFTLVCPSEIDVGFLSLACSNDCLCLSSPHGCKLRNDEAAVMCAHSGFSFTTRK